MEMAEATVAFILGGRKGNHRIEDLLYHTVDT